MRILTCKKTSTNWNYERLIEFRNEDLHEEKEIKKEKEEEEEEEEENVKEEEEE